ncbi:glutamate formimidoyltransferase [Eubacteriales bacterium OttesenSCG-928-A19]|nr:glutamate formimidoyltransferase [Eubacteriales bacterium OttesenSCG-928-A19]
MIKIVECVPNISEGRDSAVVEQIADAAAQTPGCTLLGCESDPSHNRSVITFIGGPEAVVEAAVALAVKAAGLIDLTRHQGEHPRMGAVDVIPFIPIRGVDMGECVALSKLAGERIAREAGLPVILYEESASAPHRRNLADVRRGQFEGLPEKLQKPEWTPDFGGPAMHPTGGVVAVGARMPLIAFNINLGTDNLSIAKEIAKVIRQSSGGLPHVKALGIMLEERNTAQVSINMTDYTRMPLYRVVEVVRFEAARYGVPITGTEIVGLTPTNALIDSAVYYLGLERFDREGQVLENHLSAE